MLRAHRIRNIIGALAVATIVVPLGVGIARSVEDAPGRHRDYVCIVTSGQRCPVQPATEESSAP